MRKIICTVLAFLTCFLSSGINVFALQELEQKSAKQKSAKQQPVKQQKPIEYVQNARPIKLAFVFDGNAEKNKKTQITFKQIITRSLAPNYKAVFDDKLVFVGNWTEQGAKTISDKALASDANMVISLGYFTSNYLNSQKNKKKFVVTIDQYGLRELGKGFFNPIQLYVNDFIAYQKLVKQNKTVVFLNEYFYNTQKDWNGIIQKKFADKNIKGDILVIPVGQNYKAAIEKIPAETNAVYMAPLFNLTAEQRKDMFAQLTSKGLPTFSSAGKEDVELGALLGSGTHDTDRKLAEATSFSIHSVLHGVQIKPEKIAFVEDNILYINIDTAEELKYDPPLRLLNNCDIITHKKPTVYTLENIFTLMETSNLDIKRKQYLVSAARRAATSSVLRYLPTLRIDLGYQKYNGDYARSYNNVPLNIGQFVMGIDQIIYSPDLVTNILIKNKKLKFDKAERVLTEQNIGIQIALLYIDSLLLENMVKVQEENVKLSRENLAIARIRKQMGVSSNEEVLRWAGELSNSEQILLNMRADNDNVKIHINKLLNKDQKERFVLAPLKADDPAFYTKDIHVIDYVGTPQKLEKFTDMLVEETIRLSPETVKLRAAIAMKKIEMGNYAQKFVLPDAKISFEYGSQFNRNLPYETAGHKGLALAGIPYIGLNTTSGRMFIGAQWKPIEGGHKIAEIARCKAELNELNTYLEQINTEIEQNVREVVNRALAKYFTIEKSYKAMFAEGENYQMVKAQYLEGKAPITQLVDAQKVYLDSKLLAMNSQFEFFKELMWVQRGLVSINWTKASPDAKQWIEKIKSTLDAVPDFVL